MLLAAGRGERMRPLTDHTPKPLLTVGGKALIEHHLECLAQQGFRQVVINLAWLGDQITAALSDGKRYGLRIRYSNEQATGALETAGGIRQALPMLTSDPFLVINGDIWTDLDFREVLRPLSGNGRLVMVPNPEHHPNGDFYLDRDGHLRADAAGGNQRLTFSGIALYRKSLFSALPEGKRPLAPILRQQISEGMLEAFVYQGNWTDVGTPDRLATLQSQVK